MKPFPWPIFLFCYFGCVRGECRRRLLRTSAVAVGVEQGYMGGWRKALLSSHLVVSIYVSQS